MKTLKNNLAFIFLAAIFAVSIYFIITISMASSEDKIIYLSSGSYENMSVARTISCCLVWGTSEAGTTPTHSILYPALLGALYGIFGVKEALPLIVNVIAGFLVLCLLWYFLRKEGMWQISAMTTGFFIYLSSSLPFLIMQGNEIILLIAASIIFIYYASELPQKTGRNTVLAVCSALLAAINPEGLLLAAAAAVILAAEKQYKTAGIVFLAAVLPLLAGLALGIWNGYEIFSMLKPEQIAGILFMKEYLFPIVILAVTAIAAAMNKGVNSKYAVICRLVLAATVLKILFMKDAGSQESVLFSSAFSIFAVSVAGFGMFPDEPKINFKTGLILTACFSMYLIFLYPMIKRGINTYAAIPDMSRGIYERTYRLGLFVKECCDKKGVVSDHAGAIEYLADIDFIGIGKAGPAKMKEEELAGIIIKKNAVISIASAENTAKYMKYFPEGSVKIREWVISGGNGRKESLVFYCLKESERRTLSAKLNNFSAYLPPDIKVR